MSSSSLVCLVLCLYLAECMARPLVVLDDQTAAKLQDVKILNMEVSDGAMLTRKDTQNVSADDKGNCKDKMSCSRKILPEIADNKEGKTRRSTLESPPSDAQETVNSKGDDMVEGAVVMDYEQPHRKPPIHNWKP